MTTPLSLATDGELGPAGVGNGQAQATEGLYPGEFTVSAVVVGDVLFARVMLGRRFDERAHLGRVLSAASVVERDEEGRLSLMRTASAPVRLGRLVSKRVT